VKTGGAGLCHTLTPPTVWKILNDAGIDPAPNRHSQTWPTFLSAQAKTILAAGFFHADTATQVIERREQLASGLRGPLGAV
jgi:hypothetical protein